MKICVYFKPGDKRDNFEGARLRENIKKALKENNIVYASNIVDTYDVIHFLSIADYLKINDAKEAGIPVVLSALNCESDDSAKFLIEKSGNYSLSPKTIKVLNKVDVILVSDEISKNLLTSLGIKSKIEIVTPGVDLSRFEFDKDNEHIFHQYFQVDKNKKYVVVIGTYDNPKVPKTLMAIAEKCPDYSFFYFGDANTFKIIRQNNKVLPNVRLCQITDNEIYCSMMKSASIYLSLDNSRHSPITLLDAMGSKTQIVALEPTYLNKDILENAHAYVGKDIDEVSSLINSLMNGELKEHVEEAYQYACDNSTKNIGKQLVKIYHEVMEGVKK